MNPKDLLAIEAAKVHAAGVRARGDAWRKLMENTRLAIGAANGIAPERVPISTVVAALIMEMAASATEDANSGSEAFHGLGRALAAMAIAQNFSEDDLMVALKRVWAPTFKAGDEMRAAGVIDEIRARRKDH